MIVGGPEMCALSLSLLLARFGIVLKVFYSHIVRASREPLIIEGENGRESERRERESEGRERERTSSSTAHRVRSYRVR